MRRLARYIALVRPARHNPARVRNAVQLVATVDQLWHVAEGSSLEKAIALCNLFLAIQAVDAWVILGRDHTGQTAAVLTLVEEEYYIWSVATGEVSHSPLQDQASTSRLLWTGLQYH